MGIGMATKKAAPKLDAQGKYVVLLAESIEKDRKALFAAMRKVEAAKGTAKILTALGTLRVATEKVQNAAYALHVLDQFTKRAPK